MKYNFLDDYYTKDIPDDIYRKINKDQQVNRHFRSDNVGRCAEMFDDFFKTTPRINKRHWEKYYFNQRGKEPLVKASEFIAEKHNVDLQIAKQYVYYRVIGQTWNGMITEINVINEMEKYFRTITFMKADYEKDCLHPTNYYYDSFRYYYVYWESGYGNRKNEIPHY